MPVSTAAPHAMSAHAPPPQVTRYGGYLIRYSGKSFTVSLAGDEVMHQPYPDALSQRSAEDAAAWVLEQAKAFVDAYRAGHV